MPVPPSTPSSRGRSGVANGGFERATQAATVPQSGSLCGPYFNSGGQCGPYHNMGVSGAQTGFPSFSGCQPCFGGFGFPSQISGGAYPVPGQREGRMSEGLMAPPGGLTPQASVLQQIAQLVGGLNSGQTRELQQMLAERTQTESRQLPEFFGDLPRAVAVDPFIPDVSRDVWNSEETKRDSLDAFSKSEKWLSPAPVPLVETWRTRELEILGWSDYLTQVISWSAQGSELFSNEISQASKWPTVIDWNTLTKPQRSRSTRLYAILKSAFVAHPRTSMLISVFGEGMNLVSEGVFGAMPVSQANSNGYELLRQLSLEFCLRSRGEALAMRTSLAAKSFVLSANETTVGSVVSDTIRKLDYECSRFNKLLSTLPPNIDPTGLNLPEADILLILLRSLPSVVRDFCLHHSTGDSLQAYRRSAMRWEEQQRMFQEVGQGQSKKVSQLSELDSGFPQTETYRLDTWDDGNWDVSAVGSQKCSKCGSRKHSTNDCVTDMSRVKCFRCGISGHIGMNCPNKQDKGKGSGDKGRGKGYEKGSGKGKQNGSSKGKGKGFKGGRKGKLNELSNEQTWDDEQWWTDDYDWYWYETGVEQLSYWGDYDWNDQPWDNQEHSETVQQGSETKPNEGGQGQGTQSVGSLVLSAVFETSDKHVSEDFCSFSIIEQTHDEQPVDFRPVCFVSPISFEADSMFCEDVFPGSSGECREFDGISPSDGGELECLGCQNLSTGAEPVGIQDESCMRVWSHKGFGVIGDFSNCELKNFHDGLICDSSMSVRVFRTRHSTFLNYQQEMSSHALLGRFAGTISHLLSGVAANEGFEWWLLDSGAAVTVLAHQNLEQYGAQVKAFDVSKDNFCAANGSSVSMHGKTCLSVRMSVWGTCGDEIWKHATINSLVGDTRHNILSTTVLARSGWTFQQDSSGARLWNESTGVEAADVIVFSGCPWMKLHPDEQGVDSVGLSVDIPEKGLIQPLSKAARNELEAHRNQGHTPHNPNCVECARGRTTFKHRRRSGDVIESEVQADFGFISQHGEVSETESPGAIKVLVMTEMVSNAIAYVVVNEDVNKVRGQIMKWLLHFGLESERMSIVLHTDAEQAVRNLVTSSSSRFSVQVRKAGNQQHQSIGGAERGVRRMKESLAILRADLTQNGWDVRMDHEHLNEALTYLALMHNHYGKSRETDMSPLEMASGRRLSKPATALFGSTVLAEIPLSLKKYVPNETRSIEASFLHPGVDHGPVVQGVVRIDDELQLVQFCAKNIRTITPISWKKRLCDSFLRPVSLELPDEQPQALPDHRGEADEVKDLLQDMDDLFGPSPSPDGGESRELVGGSKRSIPDDGGMDRKVVPRVKVASDSPTGSSSPSARPEGGVPYVKTRHCKACESGMVAPGIRHSAQCKRNNDPVVRQKRSLPPVQVEQDEASGEARAQDGRYSPSIAPAEPEDMSDVEEQVEDVEIPQEEFYRSKRKRSDDEDELEREIKKDRVDSLIERYGDLGNLGMFWQETVDEVQNPIEMNELGRTPATSPNMYLENVSSIRYDPEKAHVGCAMKLGGGEVKVWQPTEAVDDSTLALVDVQQCFEGMKEEVENMNNCDVGRLLNSAQVDELKGRFSHARIIQSRWVVARKSDVRVRARVVAKDIARGATARQLGYSSPTPSAEGLNMMLTYAAVHDLRLRSLDISHAFMHSVLPKSECIILKLPQSISLKDGSIGFLRLSRALNGLRDASLHWLNLLSRTIRTVGVWNDSVEPCIYQGSVSKEGSVVGVVSVCVYVDDILITASNKVSEEVVVDAISGVVPTKTTGVILPSAEGGGSLTFIGRTVNRRKNEVSLYLSVDPQYLMPVFEDYQVKKGSNSAPDVASFLEKVDEVSVRLLSNEGYAKFRKALGKLLWLSQIRHDLKLWLSLIGSLQSKPTVGADNALKSVVRFMFNDRFVQLRLPSGSSELSGDFEGITSMLHIYSDASHAPYRFNQRKGVSGEVIMYRHGLIRTSAKQQQAVSLSSCEAELYAIQGAAQDAVGLARFVHRYLIGVGELDQEKPVNLFLETDSMSAIQLLHGMDIPRKSRHVEVRVHWLKAKLEDGSLVLNHKPGTENCADMFTKCLGTRDFLRHRDMLGFVQLEQPFATLQEVHAEELIAKVLRGEDVKLIVAEICCQTDSCLKRACMEYAIEYVGVSANMQTEAVQKKFDKHVVGFKKRDFWLHVHMSAPCTSGSPLRFFNHGGNEEVDAEWCEIIASVGVYFEHADGVSFELPTHNLIWKRFEIEVLLKENQLAHEAEIFLCQTDLFGSDGLRIGKSLLFKSNLFSVVERLHKKFGLCLCDIHTPFSRVSFTGSGFYTMKLARGLLEAFIVGMTKR